MSGEERDETPRIDVSKIRAQWEHRKSPNIGTPSPSRSSIESSRSFNSTSTTTRSALSSASPPPRPPKAAHLSSIQPNTSQSSDSTRTITEQSPGLLGNVHRTENNRKPSLNLPVVSQPSIASPEKRNLSPTRSPRSPASSAKVPQLNGHHPTRLPPSAQPPSRKTTMEENNSRVGINPSGCQLRDDLVPVASPRSSEGDDETASRRSTQSSNSERPASSQKQKIGIQKPIHGFLRWSNNVKGYTVNRARTGAQSMLDKTGFYHVYLRTKEDIDDAKSSQRGQEGICSRCRSIAATFGGTVRRQLGWSGEWATPLSRILLHSNWCLLCGLILNTMCDPELDPLRHPAVANYIQPHLKGHTMKTWAERGWEFNELNWPFGHGDHRHEGSSHVLSAAFEPLETLFIKALYSVGYRKLREILGSTTANFRVAENEIALREELQRARAPSKHPLSCVVKITRPEAQDPSLLMVTLWGFGRQPNASLQVLSSFPLFLADSNSRHDSLMPSYNRLGKLLDPRWIDPSVAKTWLKKCKERHGTKCSAPGWASSVERPASLRVLDIKHLCIKVPSSLRACEYVALSYVWGKTDMLVLNKGNYEMLTKKDGLQKYWNRLPRTIVDAIQVVRDMGERYLWVDTLCIIQDSPDKHEHIKNMDRIYSSALATLVAADGETADHGLIGVRTPDESHKGQPRDLSQRWAKINNELTMAAPLSTRDYNIDGSKWNARGWTYQERLLSRRLIIFTQGEVIWHCREMSCREDMPTEDPTMELKSLDWISLKHQQFGGEANSVWNDGCMEYTRYGVTRLVRPSSFVEYAKAVKQYTHRDLSNRNDILAAFAGLSHIFSVCFKSSMVSGLPEAMLDFALLWRPTERLTRRDGFPSWSWCGWMGQVAYDNTYHMEYDLDGKLQLFKEVEAGEEGIRPLIRWYIWREEARKLVPVNRNGIGFPYRDFNHPADWEKGPSCLHDNGDVQPATAPGVPSRIPLDRRIRGQCLYFWGSITANIKIGPPILQQRDAQWKCSNRPRRLELQNQQSQFVGNVLLDGMEYDLVHHNRYEFIQMAEAKYHHLDGEENNIRGFPLYLVLMVEWDDERKIATRLGVGRVYKEAWRAARPELEFIQLG